MSAIRFHWLICAFSLLAMASGASANETVATFRGTDSDYNLAFSVQGHWELHWQVEGNEDFPSISQFEVRLVDAISGRYLGLVGQKTGSGSGIRYLTDGGRFFLHVLGRNVRWRLDVVDVDEPWDQLDGDSGKNS